MGNDITDLQQAEKRGTLIQWAERIIQQQHYESIERMPVAELEPEISKIKPCDVTCLFRMTELVFNKDEGSINRLTTVLNALHSSGTSCLMLLQCQNSRIELYLGAVNKHRYENKYYMNTVRSILREGISGNLPGTELQEIVSRQEIEHKINQCINNGFDSQCVTAVSCVPSECVNSANTVPGMENLLEAVGTHNFTLMVLADPVSREQMRIVRQGYENLSTQLSLYREMSVSVQSGKTATLSENISHSFTESVNDSISMTQSHTSGVNWNKGTNQTTTNNNREVKLKKSLAVAAGLISTKIGDPGQGHGISPFFAMQAVNTLLSNPEQEGRNQSSGGSTNDTNGIAIQKGNGHTIGKSSGKSSSFAKTEGTTIQVTTSDKHASELIARVDWYLKWLNRCENYGMFNSCAYIISSNAGINLMVASQYQALMQGSSDMSQPVSINTWTRENGVEFVREALTHMMHPMMKCDDMPEGITPAMLMSSRELSRQIALPQKSIPGISVVEYASFGREIVRKTPIRKGKVIRLGDISHMGKVIPGQPVLLDLQSLTSHTFVAGTNGSGKSNTVFQMIEQLWKANVPVLVIEPAKGEYKNVLGHTPNVKVYGTNKKKTNLLHINPFWFNEDIEINEHIDKLLTVFNASWSMSAAMPQVLKSAIENAYCSCGWDLKKSQCRGMHPIFPTIQDVLQEFKLKMNSTAFSDEVKGNYEGALTLRMESLCTGIYGEIFNCGNLSDTELFDSNVVVDLSRIGSAETKAMIMGMLVIRLVEYRMRNEAMNLPLQHVAILEEAHHLLRATSMAQTAEGSNLLGKSVEMISTAIAEMRSYGQGFIIVDQSPGLLDRSVIRNTNTKIIMRLPESEDREIVGKSIGLTPEQIDELSRLKTGVAAVYQKDSLEAVLCQIDRAHFEAKLYTPPTTDLQKSGENRTFLVKKFLECYNRDGLAEHTDSKLIKQIVMADICGSLKRKLLDQLSVGKIEKKLIREVVNQLTELDLLLPDTASMQVISTWYAEKCSDVEQIGRWGDDIYSQIINLAILQLSEKEPQWKRVIDMLPDVFCSDANRLKEARGRAFSTVMPLNSKRKINIEEIVDQLEEDYAVLKDSSGTNMQLAQLLRKSLDTGAIRQCGELQPYTSIIWQLMGGETAWSRMFPMLQKNRIQQWDSAARQVLAETVITDYDTQTSILSIYLQCKGALPAVKSVFAHWLRLACKNGNSTTNFE